MSKTQHTSRPWRIVQQGANGEAEIRTVGWPGVDYIICRIVRDDGISEEQADANAHLLVVAPDLLAIVEDALSLRKAEHQSLRFGKWPKWEAEAKTIIAKIKGE
jgi:hypothetical protein